MHERLLSSIGSKIALSETAMNKLKQFFIPKKIRKRQYLLNAGDVCQYITFVEKGLIRSFTVDDQGHEHVVQFAIEGWWISDMSSFLSGNEALYNIEALEDSEVLNLTKPAMDELLYTMALKDKTDKVSLFNDKPVAGALTMTSVKIQAA